MINRSSPQFPDPLSSAAAQGILTSKNKQIKIYYKASRRDECALFLPPFTARDLFATGIFSLLSLSLPFRVCHCGRVRESSYEERFAAITWDWAVNRDYWASSHCQRRRKSLVEKRGGGKKEENPFPADASRRTGGGEWLRETLLGLDNGVTHSHRESGLRINLP